jgi:iron complex outermembrane recepter protein
VSAGVGTEERGFVGLLCGGKWNEQSRYRIYGKFFVRDDLVDAFGKRAADGWHMGQGGFRVDWDISPDDSLTVHGDYYTGKVGDTDDRIPSLTPPGTFRRDAEGDISGGNILSRWHHSLSADNDFTLQLYFDRIERRLVDFDARYNTYDLDFAHRFIWGEKQELI